MNPCLNRSALAVCATLLVAGCASHSPVTLALTDLGSASKMEYGADNLRFMRSVTIHGLGGEEVVGMLTKDPDPSSFPWDRLQNYLRVGSKDMPDSLAPRISSDCSKIVEVVFEETHGDGSSGADGSVGAAANPANIASIRDQLLGIERGVAEELRLDLDLLILDGLTSRLAASPERTATVLADFNATWPRLAVHDAAALADLRSDKMGQRAKLTAERAERTRRLDAAMATPGIIVTRWTRASKSSLGLGTVAGGGRMSRDKEVQGFLVLGAPRVTTLMLGDDLIHRLHNLDSAGKEREAGQGGIRAYFVARRVYTSIYQLRAKTMAYAESQTEQLAASLEADLKLAAQKLSVVGAQTDGRVGKLFEEFEVKIRAEFARATDLGTSGMLTGAKIRMYEFRFDSDHSYASSLRAELRRADGYRPVYSARTTLDRLKEESDERPANPGACSGNPVDYAANLLAEPASGAVAQPAAKPSERVITPVFGTQATLPRGPAQAR